jgi:SEC-C motif
LENNGNLQAWRNEAFTDLLQIHETMLGMSGPENLKHVLKGEVERIKREALARGLSHGPRPLMMADLVNDTGYKEEYKAFYTLYSKLVHPSSWFVNMPTSVASEMYRFALIVNAQVYGRHILNLVEKRFGISSIECRRVAVEQVRKTGPTAPLANIAVPTSVPRVGRNAPCPCGSGKKYKNCYAVSFVD